MIHYSFPVTVRKPRVVITQVRGNLTIHSWDKQEISVEANELLNEPRQEGDTLTIADCNGDLTLWIPAIRSQLFLLVTDILARNISRNATIEGAGNVELLEVGGNAQLENIYGNLELLTISELANVTCLGGNLRAAHVPKLVAQKGVGGNAVLLDTRDAELDLVGGNLAATQVQTLICEIVGGNLDVEQIGKLVSSRKVGGNCQVGNSPDVDVRVDVVGGNLVCSGTSITHSSLVGGNARLQTGFPQEEQSSFHVGGNATLTLPDHANLSIHVIAGGSVNGPAFQQGSGFATLVYGAGASRLDIRVGGNLSIQGGGIPERKGGFSGSWDTVGREMADFGREMGKVGREINREMGKVGREVNREIRRAMKEYGWH